MVCCPMPKLMFLIRFHLTLTWQFYLKNSMAAVKLEDQPAALLPLLTSVH